ncbi:WD repeat-containing protein jip5 [Thelotrema lepadinum]|nr:WD repeat-containing protein jip5 [Thelotrema lepadinum]
MQFIEPGLTPFRETRFQAANATGGMSGPDVYFNQAEVQRFCQLRAERSEVNTSRKPTIGQKGQIYQPLTDKYEIRVARVQPGAFDSRLVCTLHHCNIEYEYWKHAEQGTRLPGSKPRASHAVLLPGAEAIWYTALSYAWGSTNPSCRILCNEQPKHITPNLELAVKRVRHEKHAIHIWADQLCIDQSDFDERSQQVLIMAQIYSRAFSTLVWLGSDPENSGLGTLKSVAEQLHFVTGEITDAESEKIEIHEDPLNTWKILHRLFTQPWFSRTWIIQETIVSINLHFGYGSTMLCWEDFVFCCQLLESSGFLIWLKRKSEQQSLPDTPQGLATGCSFTDRLSQSSGAFHSLRGLPLLSTLDLYRSSQASDPRDKVYTLLGLCDNPLRPNHANDVHTTFHETALLFLDTELQSPQRSLKEYKNLAGPFDLFCCIDRDVNTQKGPSWAVDWSLPRQSVSLGFGGTNHNVYSAGNIVQSNFVIEPDGKTLTVAGIVIDTIENLSHSHADPMIFHDQPDQVTVSFAKFAHRCHPHPLGEDLFSIF